MKTTWMLPAALAALALAGCSDSATTKAEDSPTASSTVASATQTDGGAATPTDGSTAQGSMGGASGGSTASGATDAATPPTPDQQFTAWLRENKQFQEGGLFAAVKRDDGSGFTLRWKNPSAEHKKQVTEEAAKYSLDVSFEQVPYTAAEFDAMAQDIYAQEDKLKAIGFEVQNVSSAGGKFTKPAVLGQYTTPKTDAITAEIAAEVKKITGIEFDVVDADELDNK